MNQEKSPNKPDPILQKVVKEITEILDEYDIGGHIILASRSHGEFLLHFPKWSKAFIEPTEYGKLGIRFKAKGKDEDNSVRDTVHLLQVIELQSSFIAKAMEQILETLESKMFITGGPRRIRNEK